MFPIAARLQEMLFSVMIIDTAALLFAGYGTR